MPDLSIMSMVVVRRPLLAAALLSLSAMAVGSRPAVAHGIESSLERVSDLGGGLVLQSHFSTGEPAAGAAVTLVAPGGQTVAVGQTDVQGQLRFRLPASVDAAWELRVDQGPGHRDYLELPVATAQPLQRFSSSRFRLPLDRGSLAWGSGALVLVGALVLHSRRGQG
jgi:hypothetical protein